MDVGLWLDRVYEVERAVGKREVHIIIRVEIISIFYDQYSIDDILWQW